MLVEAQEKSCEAAQVAQKDAFRPFRGCNPACRRSEKYVRNWEQRDSSHTPKLNNAIHHHQRACASLGGPDAVVNLQPMGWKHSTATSTGSSWTATFSLPGTYNISARFWSWKNVMRCALIPVALLAVPVYAAPPNVVVVLTDDLDDQSFQVMLALGVLPNIQAVASRGVRFSNSFVTNAVCAPSRATYLSGKYSHNHGVLRNTMLSAFDESATIATALTAYTRAFVGKYINGYGDDPTAAGTSPSNPSYVPPGWDAWTSMVDGTTYSMYGFSLNEDGTVYQWPVNGALHQTVVLGDLAARIATNGKPLFLTLAPVAPHKSGPFPSGFCPFSGYATVWCGYSTPNYADMAVKPAQWNMLASLSVYHAAKPSFNQADVSKLPLAGQRPLMTSDNIGWFANQYRSRYLSMLPVDDAVGKIAAMLGTSPTVWIFTSDNGWLNAEHRMNEKMAAYEEAARVPLYISGPGFVPGTAKQLVLNNDLAPTIRDVAGLPPDPLADGKSLLPILLGQPHPGRKRFLIEHWLIPALGVLEVPNYAALRTGPADAYPNRLYVEYEDGSLELYDIEADPYQLQNLSADLARVSEITALHALLTPLKSCAAASCLAGEQ